MMCVISRLFSCSLSLRMAGKNRGICHSCRVVGHVLSECPKKRRCPYCGEGFIRWLEVEKDSNNKGKKFHSCTRDCRFFDFSEDSPDKVYPVQGESSGTTKSNEVIGDLSRMLKTCATITEERDVEISLNITMRKGKAVPRD